MTRNAVLIQACFSFSSQLSGCIYLYSGLVDLGIIVGLAVHLTKLRYCPVMLTQLLFGVLHGMAWHGMVVYMVWHGATPGTIQLS